MNFTTTELKSTVILLLREFDAILADKNLHMEINVECKESLLPWLDAIYVGNNVKLRKTVRSSYRDNVDVDLDFGGVLTSNTLSPIKRKLNTVIRRTLSNIFNGMYPTFNDLSKVNILNTNSTRNVVYFKEDKLYTIFQNAPISDLKQLKTNRLLEALFTIVSIKEYVLENVEDLNIENLYNIDNFDITKRIIFKDYKPKYLLPPYEITGGDHTLFCDSYLIPILNNEFNEYDNVRIDDECINVKLSRLIGRSIQIYGDYSRLLFNNIDVARCAYSGEPIFITKYRGCIELTSNYRHQYNNSPIIKTKDGSYAYEEAFKTYTIREKYKLQKHTHGLYYYDDKSKEQIDKLTFDEITSISNINSWNFQPPKLNFLSEENEDNELYMGVELEVDMGGRNNENVKLASAALTGNKPNIYVMYDGSISNGFEIATMPSTLKAHMNKENYEYAKAFELLQDIGYRSGKTNSCGMHVNVSKKFFGSRESQLVAYGIMLFIMERNWSDFAKIARRTGNNYARRRGEGYKIPGFDDTLTNSPMTLRIINVAERLGYGSQKYDAINASKNYVFELRIFRGTLDDDVYMATLQFVDNYMRLVKDLTDRATLGVLRDYELNSITIDEIIHYKEYDILNKYWNEDCKSMKEVN